MIKNSVSLLIIFTSMIFIACERNFNPFGASQNEHLSIQLNQSTDYALQLDTGYNGNITIDRLGQIWYASSFCDTSVIIPPESNVYCKGLWKIGRFSGNNYYTIFDSLTYGINEIQVDDNRNIWILNNKQVLRIDTQNRLSIVCDISNLGGFFNSIAIDNNCIWAGGLNTGLYIITSSNITHYTSTNSILPTNSITKILVDANNTKWIALWDMHGLIKIENNNWTNYNSNNSNITPQNIWDLAKDFYGNLWLGTGWTDTTVTLMKFDGVRFSVENPKNDLGNRISGTVRKIAADDAGKVYVISEVSRLLTSYSTTLSIYDGVTWAQKFVTYGNDIITDIEVYHNELWVSNFREIYQVE